MFTKQSLDVEHRHFKLLLAGFLLLSPNLTGQSSQVMMTADQKAVSEAVAELEAGKVNLAHISVLGRTQTIKAIPYLEKGFANMTNTLDKALIARVLVELKDTHGIYWDFLANSVEHVLSLDEPDVFAYDSQGTLIPGPSSGFKTWVKANGLDESAAEQDALRTHPAQIVFLGLSGDNRAIPLPRRALLSRNYFIEAQAARGLAALGDSFSVPLIVQAASHAPTDAAEMVAQCLLYFDDPDAQAAFDIYVPKERAQGLREAKARGTGLIAPKE